VLGRLHNLQGDHKASVRELKTSISINPNFAHGYYRLAVSYMFAGKPDRTIEYMDVAIPLCPNDPLMWAFLGNKGIAYALKQDYAKGIELLDEACRFPTAAFIPFTMLAALYAVTDRPEEAERLLDQARRIEPDLSLRHMQEYLGTADQDSFAVFFEGCRKTGLLE
jgi:tetratricopeptide (TPR) repeat protein